jgi:hypothetical protein
MNVLSKKSPLLVARAKYGIRTWLATAAASAVDCYAQPLLSGTK